MRTIPHAALVVSLFVLAPAAAAQHTLYEFRGDVTTCAAAGDVDADGTPDFLLGRIPARTEVRSGRTGELIHELLLFSQPQSGHPFVGTAGDLDGDGHDEFFVAPFVFSGRTGELLFRAPGRLMVSIDDVDGDGRSDLLASQPELTLIRCGFDQITYGSGSGPGKAWVISAARDVVLYELEARDGSQAFGGALAALGDLDRDGAGDFAVLEQTLGYYNYRPCGLAHAVKIHAFSGRSGEHLWEIQTGALDVTALDDMNGDGVPDLAVGYFEVQVRSGVDGALLTTLAAGGTDPFDFVGIELDTIPDLDGDGKRELLVAGNQRHSRGFSGNSVSNGPGFVAVVSPATGAVLARVEGEEHFDAFGTWMAGLGDLNGDDAYDFIAFSPSSRGDYARVVSSEPLVLSSDVHELSLATGGTQTLSIAVPATSASSVGLLLGSLSGTSPGIPFGGALLPLVPDRYLTSLLLGQTPLLEGSPFVTLDTSGRATREVVVPAGLPLELLGRTVHHAFVLLDPSRPFDPGSDRVPAALLVSAPVPLTLIP